MKSSIRPLAYLILGTPGAGRRAVLADLIADGLSESDRALTFLSEDEIPSRDDARLGQIQRWRSEDSAIAADVPEAVADGDPGKPEAGRFTHLFFLTDGRRDPADQIEALKVWFYRIDVDFARVITVLDCRLAHEQPALRVWFDACVHFSDVVLLARREGVPNKWMSDFQAHYRDKFIPALFEFVKEGRVRNPALVLEPEARRVSHVFDDDVDWMIARSLAPDAVIEFSGDDDGEEGENASDGGGEGEVKVDPYFERRQNGHRVIELPDVRKYLPQA